MLPGEARLRDDSASTLLGNVRCRESLLEPLPRPKFCRDCEQKFWSAASHIAVFYPIFAQNFAKYHLATTLGMDGSVLQPEGSPAQGASASPSVAAALAGQLPEIATNPALVPSSFLPAVQNSLSAHSPFHQAAASASLAASAAAASSPPSPTAMVAAAQLVPAMGALTTNAGTTARPASTLGVSGGSAISASDGCTPASSVDTINAPTSPTAQTRGMPTASQQAVRAAAVATMPAATAAAAVALHQLRQHQAQLQQQQQQQQQQLAEAAATAQRAILQRKAEQQQAAAEYQAAAYTAAASVDPAQRAQATAAAQHAKTVYDIAGAEAAAAAQSLACLQTTAASIVSSPEQALPALPMTAAALAPVTATTPAQQQHAQVLGPLMQLHAATTAAIAASQPASLAVPASLGGASHASLSGHASSVAAAAVAAAAPLAQAAATAKQVATQKTMESQAAAAAYQAAALQASTTTDPTQQSVAVLAAQQAALTCQTAANEAANAAHTAVQLEQAAVATATMSATQLPASAPLAAQIAAGTLLPHSGHLTALPPQAGATLVAPTLVGNLGLATDKLAATNLHGVGAPPGSAVLPTAQVGLVPGASPLLSASGAAGSGMHAASLAALSSLNSGMSSVSAVPPPAVPSSVTDKGSPPSPGQMSVLSTLLPASTITSSEGGFTPPGSSLGQATNPFSQGSASVADQPTGGSRFGIVKAVCSSGGVFTRMTGANWDYEGEQYDINL